MADKKQPVLKKSSTPAGVFVFPYLNKPDTKFNADGDYVVKLRLEGEPAEKLKAIVDKAYDDALKVIRAEVTDPVKRKKIKEGNKPYGPELDKESGDETGATLFTFKQKAKVKNKAGEMFDKRPDLFDGAGNKIDPKKTMIYGGTIGQISFEGWPYNSPASGAGVSLRLLAVRVIELKTGGSRSASDYGFDTDGDAIEQAAARDSSGGEGEGGEGEGGGEDF